MVTVEANLFSGQLREPEARIPVLGRNPESITNSLAELKVDYEGLTLYEAGRPSFGRLFVRDLATAARKLDSPEMMRDTIIFAAKTQATKADPINGAEDGKIVHEYDTDTREGVELPGRPGKNTKYNGCDTNAEYLVTHEQYIATTGDRSLSNALAPSVRKASDMMTNHVTSTGHYIEDPRASGAESFALRVTYWKDSTIPGRDTGEPVYPVIYPLAHIQNIAGFRSAANLLPDGENYRHTAKKMLQALPSLYDNEKGSFYLAVDKIGAVRGVSTDGLHALEYLEPGDLPHEVVERIIDSSEQLATKGGYKVLDDEAGSDSADRYHVDPVWTHEQADIYEGAEKHLEWARKNGYKNLEDGLRHVMDVSARAYTNYLALNPSLNPELLFANGSIVPGGNPQQLWAMTARYYLSRKLAAA